MDGGSGSSTYASRLKAYPAKGVCGLPELHETDDAFARKVALLCDWWSAAKKIVVLTGAGISTSAGISDFRGPTGVWTLEIQREKAAKAKRDQESEASYIEAEARKLLEAEELQDRIRRRAAELREDSSNDSG